MKYINLALVIVFVLGASLVRGQDDCLDGSVARNVTTAMSNQGGSLTQPTTAATMVTLIQNIYKALTSISSPFAVDIGIGYSNNDYYSVQSCSVYADACAYVAGNYFAEIVSSSMYLDNRPRYFSIDTNGLINITTPVYTDPDIYLATTRPWFNATGWSAQYSFVNLQALSRSYVVRQSGATIFADRLPNEPCNQCRSRSPAVLIAPFVANNAPLTNWASVTTTDGITGIFNYLANIISTFQSGTTVTTIGVGFANGNVYFITDCSASTNAVQECNGNRYVAEVRNAAAFSGSNNLFIAAFTNTFGSPRDEGTAFNTTGRPWYLQGVGWTEYYAYGNAAGGSVTARSYAYAFNGGVVEVDSNPSQVCYTPTACPSTPARPSALPCSAGAKTKFFGLF